MTPETQAVWNAWFIQPLANLFPDHFTAACKPVLDDIAKVLAKDRRVRREEDEAVVSEVENWVTGKLETKILPRIETVEQRIAQHIGRTDALAETVAAQRTARESDVRTAIADLKHLAEERPETKLLQKLEALEQRFAQHVGQSAGRADALAEAIAAEREARENDAKAIVDDVKNFVGSEFKTELAAITERLKAMPGRLPVAMDWKPENVVYQGQFVSHAGALWQAKTDTAQKPGGDSWLCVARAGRDATTPRVVGTYDVNKTYKALDICASDGGSFIARRDNPGILGDDDGWQLLARQGRPGRKGDTGERGPRGERGEKGPATTPKLVSSKLDENYNLSILRSDDSLEIIPLHEAFERFHEETRE